MRSTKERTFTQSQCVLIYSKELLNSSENHPRQKGKFRAIVQLATLTGLIKRMLLVAPTPATKEDLIQYHTEVYITFLQKISENLEKKSLECCRNASESCSDLIIEGKAMYELFGLVDECPPFYGIWQWVTLVAGGSLTAARLLIKENVPLLRRCNSLQTLTASQRQQGPHTVFHWLGGRHHAKRYRFLSTVYPMLLDYPS
jgi:acetoin utilization deacetylase AcuC-like enzyme